MSDEVNILHNSIGILSNWFERAYMDDLTKRMERKFNSHLERLGFDSDHAPQYEQHGGVVYQSNDKRWDQSLDMLKHGSLQEDSDFIRKRLDEGADKYFRKLMEGTGVRETPYRSVDTCLKAQRTPPGGGFNSAHWEQGESMQVCGRYAVWMLYLNDVPHGGMTSFPIQGVEVQPAAGTLVVWPAGYTHVHHGNPPEKDCWKYVITGWYRYHGIDEPDEEETKYGDIPTEGSD